MRYRLAKAPLVVAIVHLVLFSFMAVASHVSSMQRSTAAYREFFGCINLQRNVANDPDCSVSVGGLYACHGELLSVGSACKNDWVVSTIVLLNLPAMICALGMAYVAYQIGLSQVWTFYVVNFFLIPATWWFVARHLVFRLSKQEAGGCEAGP